MKKTLFSYVLLLVCVTLFAQQPAEAPVAPLLKNGDFAQLSVGNPVGWQCVYPKGGFAVTGEGAERFITLNRLDTKAPCMLVQRNLPLPKEKSYIVSCEVRSVEDGDVMVYVEWREPIADGKFKHNSVNAKKIAATEQWQEVAFVVPVRPKESEAPYLVISAVAGKIDIRKLVLEEKK